MSQDIRFGSRAAEAETFRDQFVKRLERVAETGNRVAFWWRDDDAVAPTPALERLVLVAERNGVPLVLAVIPRDASHQLARYVGEHPCLVPVQHGWAHRDHARREAGEKAAEFGPNRPVGDSLDDLRRGAERMRELFGERFLEVLTPPWNRVAEEVAARRGEAGLAGLSLFGASDCGPPVVNTHLDLIAWKGGRRFIGRARAYYLLVEELDRRLAGSSEPVGLLTHHLAHDAGCWAFLDELLPLLRGHPGVRWPRPRALFGI